MGIHVTVSKTLVLETVQTNSIPTKLILTHETFILSLFINTMTRWLI
jgi:hypothetical protein